MRVLLFALAFLSATLCFGQKQMFPVNPEFQKAMQEYRHALGAKDTKKALAKLDQAMKINRFAERNLIGLRLDLLWLMPEKRAAAFGWAKKLTDTKYAKDAFVMNNVSWSIVSSKAKLAPDYYKFAVKVAQRSVTQASMGGGKFAGDTLPYSLDTLAYAYYRVGDYSKAVSTGRRAVDQSSSVPPEVKREIQSHLEMFKEAASKN